MKNFVFILKYFNLFKRIVRLYNINILVMNDWYYMVKNEFDFKFKGWLSMNIFII